MSKFLSKNQLEQIISTFKQEEDGYLTTTQVSNLFSSSISRINRLALWALKNSPVLASEERIWQNWKYRLFLIEDVIEYYLENKYLFSPKRINDREFQTVYVENNTDKNENLNTKKDDLINNELEELRIFKRNQEKKNNFFKEKEKESEKEDNKIKESKFNENKEREAELNKNNKKEQWGYLDEYIQDLKNQIRKNDEKLDNKENEIRLLNNESKNILSNLHNLQSQHLLLKRDVKLLFDWKIKLEDFSSSLEEEDKDLIKSIDKDKLEDILIIDWNQEKENIINDKNNKNELEELRIFKKNQEEKMAKKWFWNKLFW